MQSWVPWSLRFILQEFIGCNKALIWIDTLDTFPTIFKGHNFCDFLCAFLCTDPLLKKRSTKKEWICSLGSKLLKGSKFLPFRVDLSYLAELIPCKCTHSLFKGEGSQNNYSKIPVLRLPLGLFWTVPKVASNQKYTGCRKWRKE